MLIEKQMKYFFYLQFALFMYLPALIISEESYQRSNRLLEWWLGPQMIHWADNLLWVVCQRKIALKCFELSTVEGMEQRSSSPASPAQGVPNQAWLRGAGSSGTHQQDFDLLRSDIQLSCLSAWDSPKSSSGLVCSPGKAASV